MRNPMFIVFLLMACGARDGQRVPVLLFESELPCVDGIATLGLDQVDDLYVAELMNTATDTIISLPATRRDRTVAFTCPDGVSMIVARHASVLAEKLNADGTVAEADPEAPPPSFTP